MRRFWIALGAGILVGTLALAFVACGGGSKKKAGETPQATQPPYGTPARTQTPAGGRTPASGTTPVSSPSAQSTPGGGNSSTSDAAAVELLPMAGSNVSGLAALHATDTGGIRVDVQVAIGLEPGTHQNHIHKGTCEAQGEIQEPLTSLQADADGAATGSTNLDVPLSEFTDGNHYVAVHALNGVVVGCGNIAAAS